MSVVVLLAVGVDVVTGAACCRACDWLDSQVSAFGAVEGFRLEHEELCSCACGKDSRQDDDGEGTR